MSSRLLILIPSKTHESTHSITADKSAALLSCPALLQENMDVYDSSGTISSEVDLNSILPSLSLAPADRQRIFELRLRSLV